MTEYRAWRFLEKVWKSAKQDRCGYYIAFGGYGLCPCIWTLEHRKNITGDIRALMFAKLSQKPKYNNTAFRWKPDKRGAFARARFCKEQADKLKAKK